MMAMRAAMNAAMNAAMKPVVFAPVARRAGAVAWVAAAGLLLAAAAHAQGLAPAPAAPAAQPAPTAPADGAPQNSLGMPIDPALLNTLPELKGVVSWNVLAQVKSTQKDKRVIPEFASAVRALDKKDVKLQGFMLPIVTGERHEHFLLTMRPPHCPFCLSIGPEYIVEVKAKTPIKHTFEPIVLSGRFAVLEDDPYGLYYRLTGAQLSAAK
jgi:hypothetical protein